MRAMCCFTKARLTTDRAAHLARIALQRPFQQFAAGHLRDQRDHRGANGLMFTPRGIAEPDNLDPFFCMINSVLATVLGDINPLGMQEFRRGLRATGGEKQQQGGKVFHRPSVRELWLTRG